MTAPKIDTQAPDTSREADEHAAFEAWWPTEWPNAGTVSNQVWLGWKGRASISAAREAAAVERAFRDGLAYATNCCLCKPAQFDQAWEQSKARERLGDTAALDRLIAERVREAVEAEREACRQIVQSVINDPRTKFWGDLAEARARIVARGGKEGRDA